MKYLKFIIPLLIVIPLLVYFFVIPTTLRSTSQLRSQVDERMELIGIVWRLAGAEEFVNNQVVHYAADIDSHFAPHKNHPLIQFARKIRERDFVAFNAIAFTFSFIEIESGIVRLSPYACIDCLAETDPRWTTESFLTYIELLNQFYQDTDFRIFFNRHKELFAETERRFDEFLSNIHTEWFYNFFGQPLESPLVIISLTNGVHNYGGTDLCVKNLPQGKIIIGSSQADADGIPVFNNPSNNPWLFYTVIHELCHIFVNPIVDKYEHKMQEAGDIIYPFVAETLMRFAIGCAQTMIVEGINNLAVNMYFREHPIAWKPHFVQMNERRGFIGMRRAMRFMENFYANRHIYPHFKDFMPQIVAFINSLADNIEQVLSEYHNSYPYVVNVFPALNSTVSAGITEIRVDFSHPMWDVIGTRLIEDAAITVPNVDFPFWSEDGRTLIFRVINLERGQRYGFMLPARVLQSEETFPMRENFEFIFQTKD